MHTDLQKILSPNAFQITRVKYLMANDTTEGKKKEKKARVLPCQDRHKAGLKALHSSILHFLEQSK